MGSGSHRAALLACVAALLLGAGCRHDEAQEAALPEEPPEEQVQERVATIAWGGDPASLDPALAADATSVNLLANLMDPLVRLEGARLAPVPALAESWEASTDGRVYTFRLRREGRWSNGDRVTADDFEYAWKRVLDPHTAADAHRLYGIEGAAAYHECVADCAELRERVGVRARDSRTLEVTLAEPQPWFPQLVAHTSFLPVHRETVERFGGAWTQPDNMVTNGPFRLENREAGTNVDLVKDPRWRDADAVALDRVHGRIIADGAAAVEAFDAGDVDVVETDLPDDALARLEGRRELEQYPLLGTWFLGFNLANVPDVHQRRAMSLAVDRRAIAEWVAPGRQLPAAAFTPEAVPGADLIAPVSPWTPLEGDLERARQELERAQQPTPQINLVYNDAPGYDEIALALSERWRELGLTVSVAAQEWSRYLESLGPPPEPTIDVFRLGWLYEYPDAMSGLELWTSDSGNNPTGFASEEFDRLLAEARATQDDLARYRLYHRAESILFGAEGLMPVIPIYHFAKVTLESDAVRGTLRFNPLGVVDLTRVELQDG